MRGSRSCTGLLVSFQSGVGPPDHALLPGNLASNSRLSRLCCEHCSNSITRRNGANGDSVIRYFSRRTEIFLASVAIA